MKVSLNWLKDYIDLSNYTADEIVDKLTTSGLEVDEVIDQSKQFDKFVVGYVKERIKHPDADKLSLCKVFDGTEDLAIVCGAPNVDAGQKIALAKVGAVVPNGGFEIKKAKIRGEKSFGMICAEDELGLSEDHAGIMVLDESLEAGTPLADALGLNDVVMDIDITPNRADAFSHYGIARDLSAILGLELKELPLNLKEEEFKSEDLASVEIKNEIDCPRYVAKVVKDVTVKESPEWLQKRITAIGLRPINNVVDVTNYILHDLGQPLHAFDLDQLAGKKIVVKSAGDQKKFVTLDSKERELLPTDLMICDGEKPVAVAGVMGGENSEVTEATKDVLIESAYFRPSAVRKTAKKMGISTDASFRFERGCNPEIVVYAAKRAAELIAELGEGKIAAGEIDAYPKEIEHRKVEIRFSRIHDVLGYKVENEKVKEIFKSLQLTILEEKENGLLVDVPPFRHDIEREIDLIEEVARVFGYDNIPSVQKIGITLEKKIDQSKGNEELRENLVSLGLNEILTNSLLSEKVSAQFGNPIGVLNPQTVEMSHARTSLIPGMLATISRNIKVREKDLRLYEIGHVFEKVGDKIESFDNIIEDEHLLIAITGNGANSNWFEKERKYDIYDLKGIVEDLSEKISLDKKLKDSYHVEPNTIFEYSISKNFKNKVVGIGGKVQKDLLAQFDIKQDVFLFDFNLTLVNDVDREENSFEELLKFPKMKRDFAFVLDNDIDSADVISAIKNGSSALLKNVKLFDIFESESIGEKKKSLAFELEYFDKARTLTDDEVDKDFWKAIETVKKTFNAELRG